MTSPVKFLDAGSWLGHPSGRSLEARPLLPAYTFPKNRTDLAALRVVVRRGVTHDLADLLIADIQRELALLDKQSAAVHTSDNSTSFHH